MLRKATLIQDNLLLWWQPSRAMQPPIVDAGVCVFRSVANDHGAGSIGIGVAIIICRAVVHRDEAVDMRQIFRVHTREIIGSAKSARCHCLVNFVRIVDELDAECFLYDPTCGKGTAIMAVHHIRAKPDHSRSEHS